MTKMDYLKLLVDEIHSTTVATIVCISLQQREKHFMTS